jgi:hypothetical protein
MNSSVEQMAKRFAGATELFIRRNGPAILTGCGIAGVIGTSILSARAALKAQEPVKELRLKMDQASEADVKKLEFRVEIGRDALKIARIYAPAIAAGSVSIFCLISGHGLMRQRQVALMAAYTAIQQAYDAYRERVRTEIGEEKELALYRDVKVLPNPLGEELPCEIDYDDRLPSPYARFFAEGNPNWKKTPEYNLMFVHQIQMWANDRLRAYGFLFLNEVYENLGIPRSQLGQYVGWKIGNGHDNVVTFGIHDLYDENSIAFVNGVEGTILLDFNVDGPIAI